MKDVVEGAAATVTAMGHAAREAAAVLAEAGADTRRRAIAEAAKALDAGVGAILDANARDMERAAANGTSPAMLDRLALDEGRVRSIAGSLRTIADQPDPVGETIAEWRRPNGLRIRRVRTPLGVVGVIYEARPNVTADAGALCLKSGNAVILRGGSDSLESSTAIHAAMTSGLAAAGLPETAVQFVPTRDRAAVQAMLTATGLIDVIVPRGGRGLVDLVQREARVPVFAHLEGVVHVYVDASADRQTAMRVVRNAKTRRTGICGAAECLLIHREIADTLGQALCDMLIAEGVEVRAGDGLTGSLPATEADWGTEFLDMRIAARVVDDVDGAIAHVRRHGSDHTDCIVAEAPEIVERFFQRLDSAILMHNASTQFADGGEFGMGAELGIATGKMHARGPVGAEQLCSFKYLVTADDAPGGLVRA